MESMFDDPDGRFSVVINEEGHYSIWPSGKKIPAGWSELGPHDVPRQECLDYVEEVWTDMRPKSIRAQDSPLADNGGTGC